MSSSKPLVSINIFSPKAGRLDDFISAQLEGRSRLGTIAGLRSSHLYRAEDGSRAILVSGFDSKEAFAQFQQSPAFQSERQRLREFLDDAQPGFYRLVHEGTGD